MTDVLKNLSEIIKKRKDSSVDESYTASLLGAGVEKCSRKFGEEATELIIAAVSENLDNFNNEAADVLYHFLVLVESKEANLNDILLILAKRQSMSGHTEKKSRKT